jgi:Zn-dependent peptidase ImmA (M78 family)
VIGQARGESTQRFTLARALWHYLWEDTLFFLVTTAYTDRQKVERAFAAELLAPASGIAGLLGFDPAAASQEDVDLVAEALNVSPMVVQHQLENQLLHGS